MTFLPVPRAARTAPDHGAADQTATGSSDSSGAFVSSPACASASASAALAALSAALINLRSKPSRASLMSRKARCASTVSPAWRRCASARICAAVASPCRTASMTPLNRLRPSAPTPFAYLDPRFKARSARQKSETRTSGPIDPRRGDFKPIGLFDRIFDVEHWRQGLAHLFAVVDPSWSHPARSAMICTVVPPCAEKLDAHKTKAEIGQNRAPLYARRGRRRRSLRPALVRESAVSSSLLHGHVLRMRGKPVTERA